MTPETEKIGSKIDEYEIKTLILRIMDKKSYALGLGIGQNLLAMGAKDLSLDDFFAAVRDVLEDKPLAIDHKTAQILSSQYIDELDQRMTAARIQANEAFLTANQTRPGVVTLPSGLQYEVVNSPAHDNGKRAKATDRVVCHYVGCLLDGQEFDSSVRRGEPATFGLNQVIPGWTEALQLMPVGAKWKLYLPSNLAYGEHGAGNAIPPHSALIFEVELLEILS